MLERSVTVRIRTGTGRAFCVAVAALLLTAPTAAGSGGDRPAEMPYQIPGELPGLATDYRRTNQEIVTILDDRLSPRVVHLRPDQRVAWISYARVASVIVFEREVAKSIVCTRMVNFSLREDELRSAPVHAGEFVSFCDFKPGRYRYKVIRELAETGRAVPTRLDGQIIVAAKK
jgi:hypothetical protein